jgi:fatty acid desaturase
MVFHPEEFALARAYSQNLQFEALTDQQTKLILARSNILQRWYKTHSIIHSTISVLVIVFLFSADYWILLRLPLWFLPLGQPYPLRSILIASSVAGCLHSYLMYSLAFFTMHDGACHRVMFPTNNAVGRWMHRIGSNLCRVGGVDPEYFSKDHFAHHTKFGTEQDREFLNFVFPRRYWMSLLPLAAYTNFNDFLMHRPPTYTRSRIMSGITGMAYNGFYAYLVYRAFGGVFAIVTMVILLPHVGFYLDRLRQFTEHNLMPLENHNGARSFGLGFWGMLLGGGPWGSPCHLEHHLAASLPWYQQLRLHLYVRKILTPSQRKQFLLRPVIGWPRLWWRIVRDLYAFQRQANSAKTADSRA